MYLSVEIVTCSLQVRKKYNILTNVHVTNVNLRCQFLYRSIEVGS